MARHHHVRQSKLNANPGMLAGQILDGWNVGNKPLECSDYKSLSFIFPGGQESTTLSPDGSYCKYAMLTLIFCSKQLRLKEREASPHLDPPTTLCHPSLAIMEALPTTVTQQP